MSRYKQELNDPPKKSFPLVQRRHSHGGSENNSMRQFFEAMNQRYRDIFDRQVEWVLARLPRSIFRILKEVPLHVEDQPSKELMRELKIDDAEELCGYFCGVSYTEGGRYFGTSTYIAPGVPMSNSITVFRQGVVAAARDEWGKVSRDNLRQEIRITILHEIAHLHGISEEEIMALGYG